MKLFVVQESLQDKELAHVTSLMCHGLADRNHNITLVVLTGKPVDLSHYSPRIAPIFMEKTRASAASSGIARLVEREQPDLVVSHGTGANIATLAGLKVRARSTVPVVIMLQSSVVISPHLSDETRRNTAAIAVPTLYKDADLIICALQSIADTMQLAAHITPARLQVIHNPLVDVNVFETAAEPIEEEWFDARGANKLVSTGPLSNRKMYQSFLQAIALARYHENLCAFILGEGELQEELSVLASNLALEDIVTIPGVVDKPERSCGPPMPTSPPLSMIMCLQTLSVLWRWARRLSRWMLGQAPAKCSPMCAMGGVFPVPSQSRWLEPFLKPSRQVVLMKLWPCVPENFHGNEASMPTNIVLWHCSRGLLAKQGDQNVSMKVWVSFYR